MCVCAGAYPERPSVRGRSLEREGTLGAASAAGYGRSKRVRPTCLNPTSKPKYAPTCIWAAFGPKNLKWLHGKALWLEARGEVTWDLRLLYVAIGMIELGGVARVVWVLCFPI